MRAKAMNYGVNPDMVEVYQRNYAGEKASYYVHAQIGYDAIEDMLYEYPKAELLIHPECGCASSCLYKLQNCVVPNARAYFCSTEQMVMHARQSQAKTFIVATEKGMVYRLRRTMPEKIFIPVSLNAECKYMKANSLEKLADSLKNDRYEIVFCDDCCNPLRPLRDENKIHLPRSTAQKARLAIERMFTM